MSFGVLLYKIYSVGIAGNSAHLSANKQDSAGSGARTVFVALTAGLLTFVGGTCESNTDKLTTVQRLDRPSYELTCVKERKGVIKEKTQKEMK